MSRLIDSADDFEAHRNALTAAVKPDAKRKHKDDVSRPITIIVDCIEGMAAIGNMAIRAIKKLVRPFAISGLFGFLVAWAALAIYGAIKIMEKIG